MKKAALLFALFLFAGLLYAQEVKVYNSAETSIVQHKATVKTLDTVSLPFFDDFSSGRLNPLLWETNGVTVSMTSSVFPPSVGAAMFDATDLNGDFYGIYSVVTASDTLCSAPINLYYPGDATVYLSFFYEPKGLLDKPEPQDSLVLQFYSPLDSTWTTVWKDTGFSQEPEQILFKAVILPISDQRYLQNGFRFRFINYTSLGSSTYPSLVSDCDYWFVDYVYVDRNRYAGDTVFPDVALQFPVDFRFDQYSAVPQEHYVSAQWSHSFTVRFRNNDAVSRTLDSLYIVFQNSQTQQVMDTLFLGSYSFPPQGNFFVSAQDINYHIPVSQPSEITLTTKLVTDQFDFAGNNEVKSSLYLTDFYAYDDGTAEAGYGLVGDGTFEAMVAARFYTARTDTLKAVKIYFNRTYNDAQPRYFYLMVWENDEQYGIPGDLIYEQVGVGIDFDHRNAYQTFVLDTPVVVTDTFYIGWKKTDEQLMNVGLDLNNPVPNYKYYNIDGTWQASTIEGNLMIRPVFGDVILSHSENPDIVEKLQVSPNPANFYIYPQITQPGMIEVYDLSGTIRLKLRIYYPGEKIDISGLSPGVYIIRYTGSGRILSGKFVKM